MSDVDSFTGTYGFDDPTYGYQPATTGDRPGFPWLEVQGQRYALVGTVSIFGQQIYGEHGLSVTEGAQAPR